MIIESGIGLDAARNIFVGVTFEKVKTGDCTTGYKAFANKGYTMFEASNLDELCRSIWMYSLRTEEGAIAHNPEEKGAIAP